MSTFATRDEGSHEPALDRAVRARLGKLSHMPIDTSKLDRSLRAQIPPDAIDGSAAVSLGRGNMQSWGRVLRPLAAVAASLVIVVVVGFALLSGGQVRASDMAQMHRDIVAGKVDIMKVESVDKALAAFTEVQGTSTMPAMGCCMKDVAGKKVFCVLLDSGGTKVTMAVADAEACHAAEGTEIVRNGQSYHVTAMDELNMVSFERQHHRICLIGALASEKLMELTDSLKF